MAFFVDFALFFRTIDGLLRYGTIGGIRRSNDKVGGVGSHDINNFPTKRPISGPVSRGENGQ